MCLLQACTGSALGLPKPTMHNRQPICVHACLQPEGCLHTCESLGCSGDNGGQAQPPWPHSCPLRPSQIRGYPAGHPAAAHCASLPPVTGSNASNEEPMHCGHTVDTLWMLTQRCVYLYERENGIKSGVEPVGRIAPGRTGIVKTEICFDSERGMELGIDCRINL